MKLSEFSVKNSLLVNLISILILLAGFYTLFIFNIRKEAFPEVSYDIVIVSAPYPGVPPEEIEKLITVPIEKELKGVDGIEEMTSVSLDNISTVKIEISEDAKDPEKVVNDIRDAVDRAEPELPDEAEEPEITEIETGIVPVVEVALSGDVTEFELQDHAENLEDILEDVKGVSSIKRLGWRDKEVWVEVDPEKLDELRLSMEDIMEALGRRNISIPGGKLRGGEEFIIRTVGEFYETNEIENVVIRANDLGNWLLVKDVASVRFAFEDEDVINKSAGTRSIMLTVVKKSSGDAIEIVDKVKEKTREFLKTSDPRLEVSYIDDMSYYIRRRLGVLRNNGIIGLTLVVIVLMLFLNRRVALLAAIGIPIAFSATLATMGMLDMSVNLITMFGMIVVLGMLVDDGIIVAENCSRYLEEGYNPKEAAVKGTAEVAKPVTATIITTIAAFTPLMFLSGIMGKFILGIPLVVIIALLASLFEALVILPSHFSDFVNHKHAHRFKERKKTHWFQGLLKFYTKTLKGALNHRYWVFLGLVIVLTATFMFSKRIPFILFGEQEIEQFYIKAEAPIGTGLYETEELIRPIEEMVDRLPDNELDAYTTQVGKTGQTWMFDPYGKSGSHVAQVVVYTTPQQDRDRSVEEIIESLREKTKGLEGFEKIYFEKEKPGPPVGKAVSVEIRGEKFEILNKIADEIMSALGEMKGVTDINTDYDIGRGELRVVIDEKKATSSYLSMQEIASTVRAAFRGGIATQIKPTKAEEEIDVLVRFPEELRDTKEAFDKILVPNRFGNLIPLKKVVDIEEKVSLAAIRHLDGKRVITVRAEVDNKNITSFEANKRLEEKFKDIPEKYPGYSISYGGEQEENIRTAQDFVRAFLIALFLIFMILAATFNSLVQPFLVMLAIPFGLIGVIWAFYFHGMPRSFLMFMGCVALCGIVVNDSIVLVEFTNSLRRKGAKRRDSLIKAGQLRLRPVVMTTITTAVGLAPTAYGIWGFDPFLKPMALSIVWGIVAATALTLLAIPCIYAILDDVTLKIAGHGTVKHKDKNKHLPEKPADFFIE